MKAYHCAGSGLAGARPLIPHQHPIPQSPMRASNTVGAILAALLTATGVSAAGLEISWYSMAGGGGSSTASYAQSGDRHHLWQLNGNVGPVAPAASSGTDATGKVLNLQGGFLNTTVGTPRLPQAIVSGPDLYVIGQDGPADVIAINPSGTQYRVTASSDGVSTLDASFNPAVEIVSLSTAMAVTIR